MQQNPRNQRLELELEAARQIIQALFQHLSVNDIVKEALRVALEVVNAKNGSVLLANPDTQELEFYCSIGETPVPRGTAIPWSKGIAGQVFQSGEALIIEDVQQDPRHFVDIDVVTGFKTHDLIAIPLKRWEGDPIGVMEVMNKRDGRLDKDDISILTIISATTAVALEQAQLFDERKMADLGRMVGNIAHDIKNMLMPITNGTWLLKLELEDLNVNKPETFNTEKGERSQKLCVEIFEMIDRNIRRIQERMREIAECVKRLSSPPQFGPCHIKVVIDAVIQFLAFEANQKNVFLRTQGLEELPEIQADDRRLFTAFYNLVNNALAEVSGGGWIEVKGSTTTDKSSILVSVMDNGPGMSEEVRKSLFTNRVVSRKPGGTGLGTKIVKDEVDAHGGEITVESKIGEGTTFNIRLPTQPPRPTQSKFGKVPLVEDPLLGMLT